MLFVVVDAFVVVVVVDNLAGLLCVVVVRRVVIVVGIAVVERIRVVLDKDVATDCVSS